MDLLDLSSRVPMMIRAPWIQSSVGVYDSTVVELLDVYRTAADLAGIPVTKSLEAEKGYESLGGRSMVPLLERDPEAGRDRLAFTQYPRCATREGFPRLWPDGPFELTMKKIRFGTVFVCMSIPSDEFTAMGYSGAPSRTCGGDTAGFATLTSIACHPQFAPIIFVTSSGASGSARSSEETGSTAD